MPDHIRYEWSGQDMPEAPRGITFVSLRRVRRGRVRRGVRAHVERHREARDHLRSEWIPRLRAACGVGVYSYNS